jgi:outer membrane protein OmpA-like peptidoglycan-associated protein
MRRSLPFAALLLAAALMTAGPARAAGMERYIIFFGSWSALIGKAGKDTVSAAAAAAKKNPSAPIKITGYASTVGGKEANALLSELRAQMVADELVADGVDKSRIALTGTGETPFVMDPLESRRVLIEIGTTH